jgi:UDP-glucose 4-epimerase
MGGHVLITGGTGFIGSHLADKLMSRGFSLTVLDNLSNGSLKNVERWLQDPNFTFIRADILNNRDLVKAVGGCGIVFHLAANPEVRISTTHPEVHYEQNIQGTFNLLEAIRKGGDVKVAVFTSSSTVYGEASEIPTREDYGPLKPISVYGSSKLSCEALVAGYAQTYGFKAVIYRLANIIGPRNVHGVVYDFVRKLRKNPRELKVLGDGTQKKSYLLIDDCIDAIQIGLEKVESQVEIFNVGSEDQIDVKTVASIVIQEMGLGNVRLRFTGGVSGGRGWVGDVRNMLLETSKLRSGGWKPRHNSEESVRLTVRKTMLNMPPRIGTNSLLWRVKKSFLSEKPARLSENFTRD